MRTNCNHYGSDEKAVRQTVKAKHSANKTGVKKISGTAKKTIKVLSYTAVVALVAAILIIPTNALAPSAGAFGVTVSDGTENSSDGISSVITEDSVPVTAQTNAAAEELSTEATEAETSAVEEETEAESTVSETEAIEDDENSDSESEEPSSDEPEAQEETVSAEESVEYTDATGTYLMSIDNPDTSYSPSRVTLSDYDRSKLERLVMGEAGVLGYNGCALVAQAIRDAMNRSGTTSIDAIISEYQYYAPTNKEPSQDVKDAVSYIFDSNGSAVQHRVLCFYTGTSSWHETQNYIISCGSVRFFDMKE